MIVVIDNYDSFTYNIVQYLSEWDRDVRVYRNDAITVDEIAKLCPSSIVISPGPGTPDDAGISRDVIAHFAGTVPILGVCLGHQCIAEVFGGKIIHAPRLMHGKTSMIMNDGKKVYAGLPKSFIATRYHSLIVDPCSVPSVLTITARTAEKEIMGLRHKKYAVEGVQFHPESILTGAGKKLLHNFVKQGKK